MSKDVNSLRSKRFETIKKLEGLLATAQNEDRDFNAAESDEYDSLKAEVGRFDTQIARIEDVQRLSNASAKPIDGAQGNGEETAGFKSFGEQLRAVYRAAMPDADGKDRLSLMAAAGMSESVPSDGGFLVQRDFSGELLKRTFLSGAVSSRVRRIPISSGSNGLKMLALDDNSRVEGSRWGGIQAFWTDEGGLKKDSKTKFRTMELNLKKLTGLCYATDELLQDAAALESIISQAFQDEFAFKIENAIINGTGTGQPLGFLNSGATVQVAIEAGQTLANSPNSFYANFAKMWARLPVRSQQNAVWLINGELQPYLMQSMIGGSTGTPIYMPPGGMTAAPYGTIFGRPVIPVEYTAAVGTPGDIILADLSEYILIDKGGVQSASSIHVRFIYDETTFRFVYRCDGQPTWNAPLTPANGANTLAPFVTLAART